MKLMTSIQINNNHNKIADQLTKIKNKFKNTDTKIQRN